MAELPQTVVYIHGIGNQYAPSILKKKWDEALFKIDMGERTRIAYWADIRYPQPLTDGMEEYSMKSQEISRPALSLEVIEEMENLLPYGDEAQSYARVLAKKFVNLDTERHIKTEQFEAKVFPGFLRSYLFRLITKAFIQDTAAYFFDKKQREAMRERLRGILIPEGGPYIVVAHSQGTIIAYDVLRELESSGVKVPLFVTIGSPLGTSEIQDHLLKPLSVPQQVDKWLNFADLFDPVAFDKGLKNEFSPHEKICDKEVHNLDRNPHSSTGYLGTKEVQQAVKDSIGSGFVDPLSSFVIAKNVASDMSDAKKRVLVLIELNEEMSGNTLEEKKAALEKELCSVAKIDPKILKIDPLRRYIAAELTASELHYLSARHKHLKIANIWKNSEKRALLDSSTHVVKAFPAHIGYGATGKDISWAVLDTGIQVDHPHFSTHNNIKGYYDCTRMGEPVKTNASDKNGHGSHVAGIIAGAGNSKQYEKIKGIAPEANLYIYKVLDDDGRGNDSWIIKALDHIACINESSPGLVIHGINLSLGGYFDPSVYGCGHSPICRELRRLWRMGVVVCIAAGNEGRLIVETINGEQDINVDISIGDPANLEEAIAVGSVHKDQPHMHGISYFSSRGPTADGRAKPDVVAPGEKILSCNSNFGGLDYYIKKSGTSMACPHVSGVIAAFLSVRREFIGYPDKVKEVLLSHCTDLKRDRYHQGAGIPNLVMMLTVI